jgi:uncharacterized protein (DUF1697 family)
VKYIALLRAINVGGHTVKMDRLRRLFEDLGLDGAETFIASGNVIFDTRRRDAVRLEQDIEAHLRASLGYEVSTFLRTPAEIAETVNCSPFAEDQAALYVGFARHAIDAEAATRISGFRSALDELHVRGREIYWRCNGRASDSKFSNAMLEKTLRGPATMRNITTVAKLAAKYGSAPLRSSRSVSGELRLDEGRLQ